MDASAWREAPRPLRLAPDEVHVWRAPLDPPPAGLAAVLDDEERSRAARFRFDVHRHRFVAARAILRTLLAGYLEVAPAAVRFRYSAAGKPSVDGDVRFNVSHSEALGLFAFTRGRDIGVDVERVRPLGDAAEIVGRFFSPREIVSFWSVPAEVREVAFYTGWVRKEAYIKACGDGLSMPLDAFDVSLAPDEPARILATRPGAGEGGRWELRALDPGPGHVGALVVEGRGWTLSGWSWPAQSAW